jgi:uncharacterized protein (TIGR02117 family)
MAMKKRPQVVRGWRIQVRKWATRFFLSAVGAILTFSASAWILGNTPINQDFQHAETDDGVEILLVNNGVHVDIVVPLRSADFDWMQYLQPTDFVRFNSEATHCMLGWGNREFYMETPTWSDLKMSSVLKAFAGMGNTVVHVGLCSNLGWDPSRNRRIRMTREQYERLCKFLLGTFRYNSQDQFQPILNAHYGDSDAFYEANGHYNLFRTCNVWAGQAMAKSGVRVGYWTWTPELLFSCLPESYSAEKTGENSVPTQ